MDGLTHDLSVGLRLLWKDRSFSGLWQSAYAADASMVGRDVRIDGTVYNVVGVMPQDFVYQRPDVMLWRALAFTPIQKSDQMRHSNNFQQIARLRPGATFEQAQAEIDRLNAANLDRFPQFKEVIISAGFHTIVTPLQDDMVRDVRTTLCLMWGGALFVLLIGSVNVANLALVRSRARLRELATRVAPGARRSRIARQLITESLMLAMVSSLVGLAVGWGALQVLGALNIQELPRGREIRLDMATVGVTLAAGALIGIVLGLIPLEAVLPASVTTLLREEGRWRSHSCCWRVRVCFWRASSGCWLSIPASGPTTCSPDRSCCREPATVRTRR